MRVKGGHIIDDSGRVLLLRGCNLGGSSKIPLEGPSFVGRPFPPEEAEEHFEKLRRWGFTFIRFIITWEALEHEGPGIYDEAYLAYLRKILLIAEKKGISVFLDPHQDAWSRWTGGDGAPAWTLEKLGMDLDRLDAVGAALTREHYGEFHDGKAYPQMIWPVNYNRYGAATLFTLFFGGNTYAPGFQIEGESAQDWLQERYIACMRHCYRRLKNCKAITGWGTMNEPHPGFIGYRDLTGLENYALAAGAMPTPFQAMAAASGFAVQVPVYKPELISKVIGSETLNPDKRSLFKEGFTCPWRQAGVWTVENGEPRLLKRDHFARLPAKAMAATGEKPVRFTDDFLKPFMYRFMERMREADRGTLFFIEGVALGEHPHWTAAEDGAPDDRGEHSAGTRSAEGSPADVINAFHWYDSPTLFLKWFIPWLNADLERGKLVLGRRKVAAHFSALLAKSRDWTREQMGNIPAFLGEFGLPFDLNGKKAYKTGNYRIHEEALSLYYDAIDENLLHSAIWNYTADNTHDEGDRWNGEDLSIVCRGKPRAVKGWLRPYPMATAGLPLLLRWDRKTARLLYRFRADPAIQTPTEIFAPPEWFGPDPAITLKALNAPEAENAAASPHLQAEYQAGEGRIFIYNEGYAGEVEITVRGGKFTATISPGGQEGKA